MTKQEIIAHILSTMNTDIIIKSELYSNVGNIDAETEENIKWYDFVVFQKGTSEKEKVPTANQTKVPFYVVNEGEVDEAAYLFRFDKENDVDKDISGTNISSMGNIYNSASLRQRMIGALLKAAINIINEDEGTTNHSKRLKWAVSIVNAADLAPFVNVMMGVLAQNATVQTKGNATTDSDIEYVVNSEIANVFDRYHMADITIEEV